MSSHLSETSVTMSWGIVGRNVRSVPLERIAAVDVREGWLHRMFGLARVRFDTGAAAKDELVLDGVASAMATALTALARGADAVPAAHPTPNGAPASVLEASALRQLATGRVRLQMLAATLTDVPVVGLVCLLFLWWLSRDEGSGSTASQVRAALEHAPSMASFVVLGYVVHALFVGGLAAAVNRSFELRGDEQWLLTRHGMLNRVSTSTPRERVVGFELRSSVAGRLFGLAELHSLVPGVEDDDGARSRLLLPADARAVAARLGAAIVGHGIAPLGGVPRRAVAAWLAKSLGLGAIIVASALGLGYNGLATVVAVWTIGAAALVGVRVRGAGVRNERGWIQLRSPGVAVSHVVMRAAACQAVSVRQGPVDRALRLASITVLVGQGVRSPKVSAIDSAVAARVAIDLHGGVVDQCRP